MPFVPFVVVLSSGDRDNVKTAHHADVQPVDERSGERPPWLIVYNERAVPRYLALVNIASIESAPA